MASPAQHKRKDGRLHLTDRCLRWEQSAPTVRKHNIHMALKDVVSVERRRDSNGWLTVELKDGRTEEFMIHHGIPIRLPAIYREKTLEWQKAIVHTPLASPADSIPRACREMEESIARVREKPPLPFLAAWLCLIAPVILALALIGVPAIWIVFYAVLATSWVHWAALVSSE